MFQENNQKREAPHFKIIIPDVKYNYYTLSDEDIPGYPKYLVLNNTMSLNKSLPGYPKNSFDFTEVNESLPESTDKARNYEMFEQYLKDRKQDYSHCCQWNEETKKHSTKVFFLCSNERNAQKIKDSLVNGRNTYEVLPLIQNNYDDLKVFNNIAVCDGIKRSEGWVIDRVINGKTPDNRNKGKEGKGFVYHVTNVLASEAIEENETLKWDEIRSRKRSVSNYHPEITIPVCFVSITLYKDCLPDFSKYPSKNKASGKYHIRIKLPFEDICKKSFENETKLSKIYFLCSAFSQPSITQVHYICGFDIVKIKKYIEGVSKVKILRKAEVIIELNNEGTNEPRNANKETYYIIAIPTLEHA